MQKLGHIVNFVFDNDVAVGGSGMLAHLLGSKQSCCWWLIAGCGCHFRKKIFKGVVGFLLIRPTRLIKILLPMASTRLMFSIFFEITRNYYRFRVVGNDWTSANLVPRRRIGPRIIEFQDIALGSNAHQVYYFLTGPLGFLNPFFSLLSATGSSLVAI